MLDLVGIAPLQDGVKQLHEVCLALQPLPGGHEVVESCRESLRTEGIALGLGVKAKGGVEHLDERIVLLLAGLAPPLKAFLEELQGVVDVSVLEVSLRHRDEVRH